MTESQARTRGAVSLPPRHALPRDVQIPSLPGVGRTWYDRGSRYWGRRALLVVVYGVVLLLLGLLDAGIYSAAGDSSTAAFTVLVVIDVAAAVVAVAWYVVRSVRRWNEPALPKRARQPAFQLGRGPMGAILSGLAQLGYWIAMLAAAAFFLVFPAIFVVLFLMSLMPEPLMERQARLWMAERLAGRGYSTPAG